MSQALPTVAVDNLAYIPPLPGVREQLLSSFNVLDLALDSSCDSPSKVAAHTASSLSTAADSPADAVVGLLVFGHPPVGDPLLDVLPALRVVSNFGVGYDHIDAAACAKRGVAVGHTPRVLDETVADLALALLLSAARRVRESDAFCRANDSGSHPPYAFLGHEVTGAVLGIVGLGRIGCEIARRARHGFRMQIVYHSRSKASDELERELDAHKAESLEALLAQSDFVMLVVPLTPETRDMIGAKQLSAMKRTAVLINVARGGVVDTEALADALETNRIAAAALDVTDPEPLPPGHRLFSFDNVTLTPHIGSATAAARGAMASLALSNLAEGVQGKPLPASVPQS